MLPALILPDSINVIRTYFIFNIKVDQGLHNYVSCADMQSNYTVQEVTSMAALL